MRIAPTASIMSPYRADIIVNPIYTAIMHMDRMNRSRFSTKNARQLPFPVPSVIPSEAKESPASRKSRPYRLQTARTA